MAIIEPKRSLATNKSNSYELYHYRKAYKNNTLMDEMTSFDAISPGAAEFWYDRHLYGKLDRRGNIIAIREDFLKTLKTPGKTLYALNFVALAFNEMSDYILRKTASGEVPKKNTLFALLNPMIAWKSVYDKYHQYMSGIYDLFFDYLLQFRREDKINNFADFADEFYIFTRNLVTSSGAPITFSGFVAAETTDQRYGGLTIDLYRSPPSNDKIKTDLFLNDINFNVLKHAASFHGFVIDKNIPWRLAANLSSEYMGRLMGSPAFDVTYELGPKHVFDTYYVKTYTLDLFFLRKYMYDFYNSLLLSKSSYKKYKYCNNSQKIIKRTFRRAPLTTALKEKTFNVKDFWLRNVYQFRLLELNHDLKNEDIESNIKNAKSIYNIQGEMAAIKFLHNDTKRFFLNSYNKLSKVLREKAPVHHSEISTVDEAKYY
jgi:hypothetical protein